MHSGFFGYGFEIGPKFFIWSHGDHAWEKGFFAETGIGLSHMEYEYSDDETHKRVKETEYHIPLSLKLKHIYTFSAKVFFTVGLNSQLFFISLPDSYVLSIAHPKLEVSLGYAF